MCMCVCVGGCTCECRCPQRLQASDLPGAAVKDMEAGNGTWILSVGAVHSLNCGVIFSAPLGALLDSLLLYDFLLLAKHCC